MLTLAAIRRSQRQQRPSWPAVPLVQPAALMIQLDASPGREAFQDLIAHLATHTGDPDANVKCRECASLRERYHQDLIERRLMQGAPKQ